ncbi:MoxR-like ATPase [Synechococcus phage S-CREM2]|nr:MoxR-like ATPase [Synechococcus phage S-CREM2]
MAKRLTVTNDQILSELNESYGPYATTAQVRLWAEAVGYTPSTILNRIADRKCGRGKYNVAVEKLEKTLANSVAPAAPIVAAPAVVESLVPAKDDTFVPFGNFNDVKKVLKAGIFYPMFITGLSGNGKTHGVEQACAQLNRDLVRVNITIETDTDDLIGGFRLQDGDTVWHDGPVIEAMKRGAVLLLDEIDLASNKILCLQSILEGKGYFIKKTNKWVQPAAGFNVIATANTKGRGSDSGKFIGTNVLNEAFLERFAVTFEQEYPTPATEVKILRLASAALGVHETDAFYKNLADWADIIRKTYQEGGIDDVISTRRLVNILKAYSIWGNVSKAIALSTNRFDEETKAVFISLFEKVSGEVTQDITVDGEKVGEVKF